jgi:hypothetical protein
MDYKKKYEDALVKLKEHFTPTSDGIIAGISRELIEDIFPELKVKESEDERIRKALIEYFTTSDNNSYYAVCGVATKKILAWLEKQAGKDKLIQELGKYKVKYTQEILSQQLKKQGEQKPADKVEAKFKVGDTMRTLQEANNGYTDGMPVVVSIDNEYYHCTNELIAIKDQDDYEFPPINVKQKPIDMVEPKFNVGDWVVISTTKGDRVVQIASVEYFTKDGHPSYITTEGRWFGKGTKARLLTDKDVEIATIPESKAIVNKIESWSKEDEEELEIAIETLHKAGQYSSANWLKSFKDRVQLQSQPTWSEEDEEMIDNIMDYMKPMPIFFEITKGKSGKEYTKEFVKNATKWLKSLKQRIGG